MHGITLAFRLRPMRMEVQLLGAILLNQVPGADAALHTLLTPAPCESAPAEHPPAAPWCTLLQSGASSTRDEVDGEGAWPAQPGPSTSAMPPVPASPQGAAQVNRYCTVSLLQQARTAPSSGLPELEDTDACAGLQLPCPQAEQGHAMTQLQSMHPMRHDEAHEAAPPGAAAEPACSDPPFPWSGSGACASLQTPAPLAPGLLGPTFRPSNVAVRSAGTREGPHGTPQPPPFVLGGLGRGTAEDAGPLLPPGPAPAVPPHGSASLPTGSGHTATSMGHAGMSAVPSQPLRQQLQACSCAVAPSPLGGPKAGGMPGLQVLQGSSRDAAAAGLHTASLSCKGPPRGSSLEIQVEPVSWRPAPFVPLAQSPAAVPQPLVGHSIARAADSGSNSCSSPTPSLADPQFAPFLQEMLTWQ